MDREVQSIQLSIGTAFLCVRAILAVVLIVSYCACERSAVSSGDRYVVTPTIHAHLPPWEFHLCRLHGYTVYGCDGVLL